MASSPQAVLCRYHYDPLDRLAGTTPAGQPEALRFYQQNRLATEIHGAAQRTIIQHEGQLLAQQQRSDSAVETTLLATDQQRSVLQLLDNTEGDSLAYTPYGHHPADSGLMSLLGFNGEHRDPVTGHYLLGNGYRAFNPVLMRFNSPDSLSPFDEGGVNAYAYCAGDPVNYGDETGHISVIFWRALARVGYFKSPLKRLMQQPGSLRGLNSVSKFQKSSNAPVNVVQKSMENVSVSSAVGVAPPSSSRLVAVPSSRVDSMSSQILLPKDRFHAWKRLTSNLKAGLSSSNYTPAMRYKAERKTLSDIVSDSRILKKHYQATLMHSVDVKRYRTHIQKAVRYVRLEKEYTTRLENL